MSADEIKVTVSVTWEKIDADGQRCEGCEEPIYFPCAWRPVLWMFGEKVSLIGVCMCDSCMDVAALKRS